ncbi:MAG: bactofilin family protein [Terrimicrobiaceae bacterium]
MPRPPQKTPFRCPGCGFVQLEPPHLISTYCQSCGDYYEVGKSGRVQAQATEQPSPVEKRPVLCYRCGTAHQVSTYARTTICPCCSAAIELEDMTFLSAVSRPVDTRGKLTIGPEGSLSSSWIICGSAHIEGRILGLLRSESEVHLATSQVCACQITAPEVFIEKNARASFTLPVETEHLVVRGHLTGIVHCRGIVHVRRGGCLEADVHARAVTVEKGGTLLGTCHVTGTKPGESGNQSSTDHHNGPWNGGLCPAY